MSKTLVILNPVARSARRLARLRATGGLPESVTVAETRGPGEARALAAQAVLDGFTTVVAAGGDGTINEVVNGLAGTGATLGVLPVGTMNVFASELGVPGHLGDAWGIIEAGHTREIDLGIAAGQYFVQLAGAGLDAQVVKETAWTLKRDLGGPLAYLLSTAQVVGRRPPRMRISVDGREVEGCFVLIGNGRYYGGRMEFFQDARLDDGRLDVLIFGSMGYLDLARYLSSIMLKWHTDLPDVLYLQGREIRITSDETVPVELDGELSRDLPVTFGIVPRGLRVLAPELAA